MSTINELGLYALVLGSKLPPALITREHNASGAGNGHVFTFRGDGWFNMTKAALVGVNYPGRPATTILAGGSGV